MTVEDEIRAAVATIPACECGFCDDRALVLFSPGERLPLPPLGVVVEIGESTLVRPGTAVIVAQSLHRAKDHGCSDRDGLLDTRGRVLAGDVWHNWPAPGARRVVELPVHVDERLVAEIDEALRGVFGET